MAPPCRFWAQGTCKNGNHCKFEHIGPPGSGGGGAGYEPRGGARGRGSQRGGRGDHYEPRPPAQHHPDNYRDAPSSYGGRGGRGGYQGGYQGGRLDDRVAYQGQSQRGGYQGSNPRGGFQNDYEPRGRGGGRGRGGRDHRNPPPTPAAPQNQYLFDKDTLYADLTTEIPGWILSSYCPGTKAPVQLFGGEDREKSFEEMRLNHYMLREQGQESLAAQQEAELLQKAAAQIENARNNVEAAVQYVMQGENEHPNRIDIAHQYTSGVIDTSQPLPPEIQQIIHGALPSTVMAQPQAPTPTPTEVNSQMNAFGRPVSQQGQNAFGAPSGLQSNPLAPNPFGQPLQQPAQLGGAFGQAPTPFGQPHQPQQGAFGQPTQSPFGQPQQQEAQPSPFGQPSQSPFGQPQQQTPAFGAPAMNAGQNPINPFNQPPAQPAQASNPFSNSMPISTASPLPTPPTSFQPQPMQQQPEATMGFGNQLRSAIPQSNPFGQQQPQQNQQAAQYQGNSQSAKEANEAEWRRYAELAASQPWGTGHSPITGTYINVLTGQPFPGPWTDPSPYRPGSRIQHPHVSLYSTRDPQTGALTSFKNLPVEYRDGHPGMVHADGRWERVWFPDGPPGYNRDLDIPGLTGELSKEDEEAYRHLELMGRFPDDKIPRNPPKREMSHWCF